MRPMRSSPVPLAGVDMNTRELSCDAWLPAMPPYFCRLNQYCRHRGASWEQANPCPRSPRIVSPGRLTTSTLDNLATPRKGAELRPNAL